MAALTEWYLGDADEDDDVEDYGEYLRACVFIGSRNEHLKEGLSTGSVLRPDCYASRADPTKDSDADFESCDTPTARGHPSRTVGASEDESEGEEEGSERRKKVPMGGGSKAKGRSQQTGACVPVGEGARGGGRARRKTAQKAMMWFAGMPESPR